MRTTVTLDDDVERLLKDAIHRNRKSFKETLNSAIRRGLAADSVSAEPFKVEAQAMDLKAGIDPLALSKESDLYEIDAFRETTRRLRVAEDSGDDRT